MPVIESTDKKYLLLDTCMVEYLLHKTLGTFVTELFATWISKNLELAISAVTYAELLNGVRKDKEVKITAALDKIVTFPVNKRILMGSGLLGTVYREKDVKLTGLIGMADRIIAATSVVYNSPIVTANVADYPHPFFLAIENHNLTYQNKNKSQMIGVGVLQPNYPLILNKFQCRQ